MNDSRFILKRWADGLAGLKGWRRHGLAMAAGAIATLALPPLYAVPALAVALTLLFWLWDGVETPLAAARLGWSFGVGFFAFGLYWIGFAFLVDAERFAFAMPFAVLAMAGGMALFPALALALAQLGGAAGPGRLFAFAAAWLASEWLRSWIFTGFPWNLLGTVWAFDPMALQLASIGGVWTLTVVAVLGAGAPALLAQEAAPRPTIRRWLLVAFLCLGLPGLSLSYGAWRLADAPDTREHIVEGVRLRLVQPAIPQALKWRSDLRGGHVATQMRLSSDPGGVAPTHVIWAETAVPYLLAGEPTLARSIARIVPPDGLLITGAPRSGVVGDQVRSWNSLHALDPAGEIVATYDKVHLVPFGEYVPLEETFGWSKLTQGSTGFTPGKERRLLRLPGLPPASPLICYEVIFPGGVTPDGAGDRAAWLLNITNDAWFGISSGPHQHFAAAIIRAVEEGIPLVRVANNGISASVDGYGRVLDKLELGEQGFLDSVLPKSVENITLYARFGNWTLLALIAALGLLWLVFRRNPGA